MIKEVFDFVFGVVIFVCLIAALISITKMGWIPFIELIKKSVTNVSDRVMNGPTPKEYKCLPMHVAAVHEKEIYGEVKSQDILNHLRNDYCKYSINSGQVNWVLQTKQTPYLNPNLNENRDNTSLNETLKKYKNGGVIK